MSLLDGVAWQGKVFSGGWTDGSGEPYPVVSPSTGEVLATMGLHLGMEVTGWPPENIEELAKRFEDHY